MIRCSAVVVAVMERGCTLFVLVVLTVSSLADGQEGSCPQGRFGDSCSYTCNCGSSCNCTTGVCTGACDDGWREGNGALCQKNNVAYGKQASGSGDTHLSHDWTPEKAVDGNRDQDVTQGSCYHSSEYPTFWWVNLATMYRIHSVRIYNRAGYQHRLANCSISVGPDSNSETVCYTFPSNPKDIPDVIDLTCNGEGRFFIIRNPGNAPSYEDTLNICEVEIYVCSEGTFGPNCSEFCHCLNSTCDHVTGKCPGDCRPGWKGDTCSTQCDANHYGPDCRGVCSFRHCVGNSSCDSTGTCDSGCETGWTQGDCTVPVNCPPGRYGQGCTEFCISRNCKTPSSVCDVTGLCEDGCREGWQNDDCRIACQSGKYGSNCSKSCDSRHCETAPVSCDHVTGACAAGCQEGWIGEDCTRRCKPGTYGPDCTRCGHCDATCNFGDGRCPGECLDGFTGDRCDEDVRGVSDSVSPVTSGVIVGAVVLVVMLLLIGGLVICLLKSGRIKWVPSPDTGVRKTDTGGTGEVPAHANTFGTNEQDYTELSEVTREREEKSPYDVIQNKVYENNQI